MKHYASSLVFSLIVSLPVAGSCAIAAQATDLMKSEVKSGMAKDVTSGITGKVVETMTGGGYTYVHLEKDEVKAWAAFPPMTFAVGQEISSVDCMPMMDFQSKALNRSFDKIMFCNSVLKPAEAELMKKKSTGSNVAVPESTEKIVVEKIQGENVFTIDQCYAQISALNSKPVTVRGKVMKVSPRIMGRNWIHLQDGTGNASKKTNNLVVTSKDLPKVGEMITVSGIIAKDRDFGSGYKYSVIIEGATVKK